MKVLGCEGGKEVLKVNILYGMERLWKRLNRMNCRSQLNLYKAGLGIWTAQLTGIT